MPFGHNCRYAELVCSMSKNILTSSASSIVEKKNPDEQYSSCFEVLCIPKNNSSFDENRSVNIKDLVTLTDETKIKHSLPRFESETTLIIIRPTKCFQDRTCIII